ncbi:efflux RND transporter periplasmic adaptor BpeA [soil metagenome]
MKGSAFWILTLLIASFTWSSCGNGNAAEQKPAPPPVSVNVYTVAAQGVTGVDNYPATIVPLNEVQLRAEVNGSITGIFVQDGQTVKAGQRLYEIDRSKYLANYKQAQAQLKVAQSNLAQAKRDAERYQRLQEKDAIARQVVENSETNLQNAESQILVAEAALSNAQTDLNRSVITAPFAGTIGISNVKLGSVVTAGNTLINTISSTNPIAVEFAVNEKDIYRFSLFMDSTQNPEDSTFVLQLSGGETYPAVGKLVTIDRAVDPLTGTIKVRLSFDNEKGNLRAGMSGLIKVRNQDTGHKILIPNVAITEQLGEFYVYVLGDSNKVTQQRVVLGATIGDRLIVREGLEPGTTIVTSGIQNLKNGSVVNVDTTAAVKK